MIAPRAVLVNSVHSAKVLRARRRLPRQCVSIEDINSINRIINYHLERLLWQHGGHEHEYI